MLIRELARQPLTWLLAAMPVAIALELAHAAPLWIFLFSAISVIPLAGLMGRSTESLAETLGSAVGGLLNATFGNAAELIIALLIVARGPQMYPLVKATLTGSIIGNLLLVLGMAILFGGLRHPRQQFNRTAASMGATLLALATVALVMPTIFAGLGSPISPGSPETGALQSLSLQIAAIQIAVYLFSLLFTLKTHRHLFAEDHGGGTVGKREGSHWSRPQSLVVLLFATAGVAGMSELLVGSVGQAGTALGMNQVFIGVIVVAIAGNAAEHSTAVLVAMKDKMDLAINIAVGSSIQIALFVAPMLVFASMLLHRSHPLSLRFTPLELVAIIAAVIVTALVSQDGESHWMEGVLLIAVYVVLALTFYNLPNGAAAAAPAKLQ